MPSNGRQRSPERRSPGVIRADELYTLDEFRTRTGLGEAWVRNARRSGLRVLYLAGRAFIRGRDFFDFLERFASDDLRSSKAALREASVSSNPNLDCR